MKSSVEHTLDLLRNQRLETADKPRLDRIYAPHGAVHLGARTRESSWPRLAFWVVLGLGAALLCLLLVGGHRGAPTVSILSPSHKSTLSPGDVAVSIRVTGVTLSGGSAAGSYHLHYYLDATPPTAPGLAATTPDGSWSSTTARSYVWKGIAAGTHVLSVQVVRGDDTPLEPAVMDSVTIRVASASADVVLPPASTTPRPVPRGS